MNRREMMVSGAIGVAAVALGAGAHAETPKSPPTARAALLDALSTCQSKGEACVAHCMTELGQGNKSMANCNLRVHEMLALVGSLVRLVSVESSLSKKQAEICATACKACSDACNEHKAHFAHGMHLACKDCGEACDRCETACRTYSRA